VKEIFPEQQRTFYEALQMILETERLVLRNWQQSDVDCYMALAKDIGYNCFSLPGQFLVHSTEEAKQKIQDRIILFNEKKLGKFAVFLKETQEFIGTCGLGPFQLDGKPEVELGYRLCLKHWGQGYAEESAIAALRYGFGDLNLKNFIAFALPQNRTSLRILETIGFQYCLISFTSSCHTGFTKCLGSGSHTGKHCQPYVMFVNGDICAEKRRLGQHSDGGCNVLADRLCDIVRGK
jgi:[ribosomal protein S5]-alanine N-acetyltransferase